MQEATSPEIKNIPREPIIAGILSFLFLGLGQAYNGQRRKGYLLILVSIGLVVLYFILLKVFNEPMPKRSEEMPIGSPAYLITLICGFLIWAYSVYDAYQTAKKINNSTLIIEVPTGRSVLLYIRNVVLAVAGFIVFVILLVLLLAVLFRRRG